MRRLVRAWFEFERRLAVVPIVRRLDLGTFTREDYQRLLLNLRPQVVEGSRWISRCASSFDREYTDIRSVVLRHAHDEHRDYEILETDYVATGGNLVFIGEPDGTFSAHDAKSLKELWSFNTGTGINAPAVTYSVNGKQYVAVLVGSKQPNAVLPNAPELKNTSTASMLYVFGL